MIKAHYTIIVLAAIALALLLLGGSCFNPFAPTQAESHFLAPILSQSDPIDSIAAANTLANFKYAYENNDIDVYENCLDAEFVFIYIDQDRYGQIERVEVPRDGISGDLNRTRRLFEIFDEIRLDTWILYREVPEPESNPDHPNEIWEKWDANFHLSLRDISGDYNYSQYEANGWAVFKLKRSRDGNMRIRVWEDQSLSY
jgi:hypothetical protein